MRTVKLGKTRFNIPEVGCFGGIPIIRLDVDTVVRATGMLIR